jgi:4-carboxymuconolactone decarboxylase
MTDYAKTQRVQPAVRDDFPDDQKRIWDHVVETRKLSFMPNMFAIMGQSPRALEAVASVGEHVRWHSALDDDLREMVICTVSRVIGNEFEWNHHIHKVPEAQRGTVGTLAIEDEPSPVGPALKFCRLVASGENVDDALIEELRATFGNNGLVDLLVMVGYYQLLGSFCTVLGVETDERVARVPFNT